MTFQDRSVVVVRPPTTIEIVGGLRHLEEARQVLDSVLDADRTTEADIYEGGLAGCLLDDLDECLFTAKALLKSLKQKGLLMRVETTPTDRFAQVLEHLEAARRLMFSLITDEEDRKGPLAAGLARRFEDTRTDCIGFAEHILYLRLCGDGTVGVVDMQSKKQSGRRGAKTTILRKSHSEPSPVKVKNVLTYLTDEGDE